MKPRPMPPCGESASRWPVSTSTTPLGSTSVSLFTIARDGMSHQPLGAAATGLLARAAASPRRRCRARVRRHRRAARARSRPRRGSRRPRRLPASTRRRVRRRRPRVSAAEGRSRGGRVPASRSRGPRGRRPRRSRAAERGRSVGAHREPFGSRNGSRTSSSSVRRVARARSERFFTAAAAQVEGAGGLLHRAVLPVAQHDHGAVERREGAQRGQQRQAQRRVVVLRADVVDLRHRHLGAAPAAPVAEEGLQHDAAHVGRRVVGRAHPRQSTYALASADLEQVLGGDRRRGQQPRLAVQLG